MSEQTNGSNSDMPDSSLSHRVLGIPEPKSDAKKKWPLIKKLHYTVSFFALLPSLVTLIAYLSFGIIILAFPSALFAPANISKAQTIFLTYSLPGLILFAISLLLYYFYPSSRVALHRDGQKRQFNISRLIGVLVLSFIIVNISSAIVFTPLPKASHTDDKCDFCNSDAKFTLAIEGTDTPKFELCSTHGIYYVMFNPMEGLKFLQTSGARNNSELTNLTIIGLYWALALWIAIIGYSIMLSKYND